ncbi:MAG: ribonuclease T [Hyphomicrobiaceae bacterium]
MLLPIAAHAQRNDDRKGGVPGRFDYYALVLSWSPTYCLEVARGKRDPQCDRRDGRRFAFVLHGLWPQYERGYPDFCRTRDKPFVPQRTIDRMRDIMPSAGLTIHEYRKHGTCTGLSPDGYYELSRRLFEKIKIPPRFRDPTSHQTIPMRQVIDEFMAANPKLKPDMIAVSCGRPGNRIKDVRICFSREGEFRTCGGNERQRRMCGAPRVYIPPVRVGRPIPPSGRSGGGQGPQSDGRSL